LVYIALGMGARRKRSRRENLAAALRHPTRRRILSEMRSAPRESPRQLSRRLHEPLSNVSYHFRVLVECEVLEPERARPVRGVVEHLYRVALTDEEMLEALGGDMAFPRLEGEETD
jgi:DNA-binding transcriptional ArsR family regulator